MKILIILSMTVAAAMANAQTYFPPHQCNAPTSPEQVQAFHKCAAQFQDHAAEVKAIHLDNMRQHHPRGLDFNETVNEYMQNVDNITQRLDALNDDIHNITSPGFKN